MFGFTLLTTLLAATVALAQDYTINTPAAIIQCQPANLQWSGGKAPYILAVIPGGQPSAAALETLADGTSDTSYVWTVNLASGTSITLRLTDSVGDIVYSSPVTIQAGSSTDCLNASATSAAGAAGVASGASSAAPASGVSASASSAIAGASSSVAGASASVSSAVSSAVAGASSTKSAASSAVQSASSKAAGSSSMSKSATPVSSGASASSSAPNGAMSNAAPGVFLAALVVSLLSSKFTLSLS